MGGGKMKAFKTIVVTTVILTLICGIAAAGLALVNELTSDRIATAEQKAEQEAMARVITSDEFLEDTVTVNGVEHKYYTAVTGGTQIGYIFTVSKHGYGGNVKVMTGIGTDGKIIAVEVLDASGETPGLGQNVTKKTFWEQFKGLSGSLAVGGNVEAVTGATISSKAVTSCINEALDLYKIAEGDGSNG